MAGERQLLFEAATANSPPYLAEHDRGRIVGGRSLSDLEIIRG
jgi:hypothetical protein